jgi:hypothetical protein
MDVASLYSPQFSPDDINKVVSFIASNVSLAVFEQSMGSLSDPRVQIPALGQILVQLIGRLPAIENHALQIEFATIILKLAESRDLSFEVFSTIQDLYLTILESHGQFTEASKHIIQFIESLPDDETRLPYWLRIGENYLKSGDISLSFSYLTKMNSFVFRRRTAPELVERFDTLRGYLQIRQDNFLEAARAFAVTWRTGRTSEIRTIALRRACIAAILTPPSPQQMRLLREFYDDDAIKGLDVYQMVDLIVRSKFMDAISRDNFAETASDLVSEDIVRRALGVSSTQHNLSVAHDMFVSVKIARLAQLIGDTPEHVEAQLGKMIDAGTIQAEIDQPERIVVFTSSAEDIGDKNIVTFCGAVSDLAATLKAIP